MSNIQSKRNEKKKARKEMAIAMTVAGIFIVGTIWVAFTFFGSLFNDPMGNEDKETAETMDRFKVENGELKLKDQSEKGEEFDASIVWNDNEVQNTIHKMSHQKVLADVKWGAIEMTPERIETLSAIIDQNEQHLEFYDIYRDILDDWIEGDFDSVDQAHNIIWNLQDGTKGEAYGIADEEQEKEFIEDSF